MYTNSNTLVAKGKQNNIYLSKLAIWIKLSGINPSFKLNVLSFFLANVFYWDQKKKKWLNNCSIILQKKTSSPLKNNEEVFWKKKREIL